MHVSSGISLGLWVLGSMAVPNKLDYAGAVRALTDGDLATRGKSAKQVCFKALEVAPKQLPNIQTDVCGFNGDQDSLKHIADLGMDAVEKANWGDVVYLYNVFIINGHADYTNLADPRIHKGLLAAVAKADRSGLDRDLISLYVKTSTSSVLSKAFNDLGTASIASI